MTMATANAIDGHRNLMVNKSTFDNNSSVSVHGDAMNVAGMLISLFLCLSVLMVTGCTSKQDKQEAGMPGKVPPAAAVAPPQDQTDARAAAQVVLSQLAAGDFDQIYQAASPGFKKIGSKEQFVSKFQQVRKMVGVLKNPRETSFATIPNKGHVLVYRLENDLYTTDIRLSFERAADGKMALAGLNQHDEPKK